MAAYVGLAVGDSMFDRDVVIRRTCVTPEQAKEYLERGATSCVNPSHAATLDVLRERFGISVEASETAPKIKLNPGDSILVISVRGLPRLQADMSTLPTNYSSQKSCFPYGKC